MTLFKDLLYRPSHIRKLLAQGKWLLLKVELKCKVRARDLEGK